MGPCFRRDDVAVLSLPRAHASIVATKNRLSGSDMSDNQEPANLADMVRARAKSRGNATAFEFEGRQTSFAEFDIKTNRVANALRAIGVKPRERIPYLRMNTAIYFNLFLAPRKPIILMPPLT